MANQLHEFTVQEAQNFSAYTTYAFQKITGNNSDQEYTDWSTAVFNEGPAKHLIIYGLGTTDDTDIEIYLKIDGSYGNKIEMEAGDLPLTISGLLVDRVKISTTNDTLAILSFH